MLIANSIIDLARLVAKTYKPEYNYDPSTIRLQKLAANTTDDQLENLQVPRKFWAALRKLDGVIRFFSFSVMLIFYRSFIARNQ